MQTAADIFLTKSEASDGRNTAGSCGEAGMPADAPHYVIRTAGILPVVTRGPAGRTTAPHGQSPGEVDRVNGVVEALRSLKVSLFALTVAAHGRPTAEIRRIVGEALRHIQQEQRRAGAPRVYWMSVWHADPRPHAHILAAFPPGEGMRRLKNVQDRPTFARHDRPGGGRCIKVQPALPDWVPYVLEERTPQANFGDRKGRRRKGSHRLDGGGDRVRMSADLRADAIARGWVTDWKRTNARRSETRKARGSAATAAHVSAVVPHLDLYGGMLFPLPVAHAPSRQPTAPKPRRPGGDRQVEQGTLPLQSGNIELLDVLRHLGRTDAERAAAIGLSRPTVNNVRHGRFGLSREAARRILAEARSRGIAA